MLEEEKTMEPSADHNALGGLPQPSSSTSPALNRRVFQRRIFAVVGLPTLNGVLVLFLSRTPMCQRFRITGVVTPLAALSVAAFTSWWIEELRSRVLHDTITGRCSALEAPGPDASLCSRILQRLRRTAWVVGAWALSDTDEELAQRHVQLNSALRDVSSFIPHALRARLNAEHPLATTTVSPLMPLGATAPSINESVHVTPSRSRRSSVQAALMTPPPEAPVALPSRNSRRGSRDSQVSDSVIMSPPRRGAAPLMDAASLNGFTAFAEDAPNNRSPTPQNSPSGTTTIRRRRVEPLRNSMTSGVFTTTTNTAASPLDGGVLRSSPAAYSPGPGKQIGSFDATSASPKGDSRFSSPHAARSVSGVFQSTNLDATTHTVTHGSVLALHLGTLHHALEDGPLDGLIPADVVDAASRMLGVAIDIVVEMGGVVHQFNLQGLVASFNVQQPLPDYCVVAAECALQIDDELNMLADADPMCTAIGWGMGLTEGAVLAGFMGNASMRTFVACGAAVVAATDLGELNERLMTSVLMSQSFHDRVQNQFRSLLVDFAAFSCRRHTTSAPVGSSCAGSPLLTGMTPLFTDDTTSSTFAQQPTKTGSSPRSSVLTRPASPHQATRRLPMATPPAFSLVNGVIPPAALTPQQSHLTLENSFRLAASTSSVAAQGVYQLLGDLDSAGPDAEDLSLHVKGLFKLRSGQYADAAAAFRSAYTSSASKGIDVPQFLRLQQLAEYFERRPDHAPPGAYCRVAQPRWPDLIDSASIDNASIASRHASLIGSNRSFAGSGPNSPSHLNKTARSTSFVASPLLRATSGAAADFGSQARLDEATLSAARRRKSFTAHHEAVSSPTRVLEAIHRARSRSMLSPARAPEPAPPVPMPVLAIPGTPPVLTSESPEPPRQPLVTGQYRAIQMPGALLEASHPGNSRADVSDSTDDEALLSSSGTGKGPLPKQRSSDDSMSPVRESKTPVMALSPSQLEQQHRDDGDSSSRPASGDTSKAAADMQSSEASPVAQGPSTSNDVRSPDPIPTPSKLRDAVTPDMEDRLNGSVNARGAATFASQEFESFAKGELFVDVSGVTWRRSNRMLGHGAFGDVYLGMRPTDGKLVALKFLDIPSIEATNRATHASPRLRRAGQQAEERLGGLLSEVKMLSTLRHANIVTCYGFAVVDNSLVLALEYVSGGSLQGLMDEFGSLTIPSIQRYLTDVLRGLRYLHSQNIMHRDVKPANILLHVDGSCKLSDFGTSAKATRTGPAGSGKALVVGTPAFMAPEQARGMAFTTCNSDLWSVGIMAIQMLTGRMPFDMGAAHAADRLIYQLAFDPTFTVEIPEGITGDARNFIEKCLQREASSRGSAEELLMHPFLAVPHAQANTKAAVGPDGSLIPPSPGAGKFSGNTSRGSYWISVQRRRQKKAENEKSPNARDPLAVPSPIDGSSQLNDSSRGELESPSNLRRSPRAADRRRAVWRPVPQDDALEPVAAEAGSSEGSPLHRTSEPSFES